MRHCQNDLENMKSELSSFEESSLYPYIGGAYGIRTRDLFHAMEARSQLR